METKLFFRIIKMARRLNKFINIFIVLIGPFFTSTIAISCQKDEEEKVQEIKTETVEFNMRIADIRGSIPKVFIWTYSGGSFKTDDQTGQTIDVTSDKRLVLYVSSSDPKFNGVQFETSSNIEFRHLTDDELLDLAFKQFPDTYPDRKRLRPDCLWKEGEIAWDICYKEGSDGPGTISVIAGENKKTFSVNVVKDIPMEEIALHVTNNFGYEKDIMLLRLPRWLNYYNPNGKINNDIARQWYNTPDQTNIEKVQGYFRNNVIGECSNKERDHTLWHTEIIGYSPENTTCRTVKVGTGSMTAENWQRRMDEMVSVHTTYLPSYHPEFVGEISLYSDRLLYLGGEYDCDKLIGMHHFCVGGWLLSSGRLTGDNLFFHVLLQNLSEDESCYFGGFFIGHGIYEGE